MIVSDYERAASEKKHIFMRKTLIYMLYPLRIARSTQRLDPKSI